MPTNKKNLRAWVRYDGSGRIIPGSVELRVNKPKIGNWTELRAYQCCDPQYDQTTTTSTSSTTSTTTTAPSDLRLKKTIMLTGNMIGSLPEYTWKWNKKAISLGLSGYPNVGVIAQEAIINYPEAVLMGDDGYLRVDYSKIV